MIAPDDLSPSVAAALASDPALAAELAMICAALEAGAEERFWACFAAELERHARPAAATLAALERAASG